jgi:hypothetical protein
MLRKQPFPRKNLPFPLNFNLQNFANFIPVLLGNVEEDELGFNPGFVTTRNLAASFPT